MRQPLISQRDLVMADIAELQLQLRRPQTKLLALQLPVAVLAIIVVTTLAGVDDRLPILARLVQNVEAALASWCSLPGER